MGFEPQKFFVGLTDFFAVIMPGALLVFVLRDQPELGNEEQWIIFLFEAYLVGHLLFLLGAVIMDDIYDALLKRARQTASQAGELYRYPSYAFARAIMKPLLSKPKGHPLEAARRIMREHLEPIDAALSINAFQWCKLRLATEAPGAFAIVQRFEADSKFFRSFAVALCVLIPIWIHKGYPGYAGWAVGALVFAIFRYAEQRLKSTYQAYWAVITLEGERKLNPSISDRPGIAQDQTE